MIKIIFESHATSVDNEAKLASGWNDIVLSELGIKQCFELLERYRDKKLDAIITSDLQRAYKTAVPTAEELKIPIYIDKRLRECNYGDLTQKDKQIVEDQKTNCIDSPFPNGESYKECMERMKKFLNWLKENFDGKTVMIIGHRATQYGLEHHIQNKEITTCVTEPWSWQPGWEYQLN